MGNERAMVLLMMMMMMICCGIIGRVSSTVYTVGGISVWSLGTDYSTWSTGKTFKVGDTLVFYYATGHGHTVNEVSLNDYTSCTNDKAFSTDSSGATTITLETPGRHYYISGNPGDCAGGMKLAVAATPTEGTAAE